ncbi:hypothetical protein [Zavarzinia sp.]|uniref:hypothetical protein n=1 Tax=Zavarzinia sp. TaxID=2027920 RepID=UPI00356A8AE8
MRYLGGTTGSGILKCAGADVVRATYDFDSYAQKSGEITRCGEIRLPSAALAGLFGRPDVELLTDDGQLLQLKFSERKLAPASDAAHVDVVGQRVLHAQY